MNCFPTVGKQWSVHDVFKTIITLTVIFLVCILVISSAHAECRKKKVLVLHSYHQGLEWTDEITRGIKSVFDPLQLSYETHYEYLDMKRNAGKAYLDDMARLISDKNNKFQFEAIISSDNDALKLLNDGKLSFKGNPPVIFCGVNNYDARLTDHLDKVTGVAETTDLKGTIELIRALHPRRKHVLVVLDRTLTGDALRKEFAPLEKNYKGQLEFEFYRDFVLRDVPAKLTRLGDNDIIYMLTFNQDRDNNFISYSEGIEMFSRNTNVPIYGSWDFYLGKGIVGGSITSGYLQGVYAGNMTRRVLQGYSIKDMKVLRDGPVRYMFDYTYLQKHSIDTSLLPKGSKIINSPPTSYERHKSILIGISGVSLSFMLLLLWKFIRQRSLLHEKNALAIQLEKMVHERTLELEEANRELRRLSNLDGLTQIYNRRYFDEMLSKELFRLQRTTSPISLLLCDIDFFKNYNDTYGHLAGDDCIKIVAKSIQQNCKRITDVVARYGGEEFGVILPDTSPDGAVQIAESIRKALESKNIVHETSEVKMTVSLSIGVASIVPDLRTTPTVLISMSDKALYDSKHNGRDRVTLYRNEPDQEES
jgi:diguanylate cyclase (GGDEF)-like protein